MTAPSEWPSLDAMHVHYDAPPLPPDLMDRAYNRFGAAAEGLVAQFGFLGAEVIAGLLDWVDRPDVQAVIANASHLDYPKDQP
ncbi:hypothetical protein [Microbispora sp. ATCC PTA-5024]|uniref:hypothetical protein n=1 Tax=Microbispora sp. ATCC PTA-5024 TaxID=316330 RepID=UPI0003DC7D9F|nr:hypothetical protein [Microbispora sp. ATCC PTA-5024]ETK36149.1 hypothetical protein MPTA5024_11020 [Microbispora sp. ATCC PTA-5024]